MAKCEALAEVVHHVRGICNICRNMESTYSVLAPEPTLESRLEQLQTAAAGSSETYPTNFVQQRMMLGPHKYYLTLCRSCLYRFKQNPHKTTINLYVPSILLCIARRFNKQRIPKINFQKFFPTTTTHIPLA